MSNFTFHGGRNQATTIFCSSLSIKTWVRSSRNHLQGNLPTFARRPLSDLMERETKTSRDLVARSAASRPKRLASLAKRSTCSKATYIRTFSANWNWYAITFEKTRMWRSLPSSSSSMLRLPIFGKAKPRQQGLLALKMGMRLDRVIKSLLHSRSLCRHATKNSCGADYCRSSIVPPSTPATQARSTKVGDVS